MEVPFTDIYVDDEIVNEVDEVLESTRYVKGPKLEAFEKEFAARCEVDHAIGVSNGTAAILLSLEAAGVGSGDDVFVPGHTFFASVSPILRLGANPVFVDVDPETYTISVDELERAIERSEDPAVIVPVHIYGQMADMEGIEGIADEYGLAVLEDACQAHFAHRNGRIAGATGDLGAFSFYPSKNMTVGGDGGMIVTDDDEIAASARALRNHGRDETGEHVALGLNHRLDEVRAAVGAKQLEHVESWNQARHEAAQTYTEKLGDVDAVTTPTEASDAYHVYHLYVIRVPDRDRLRNYLAERGIDTEIHYETPAHRHEPVLERCGEVTLERTEQLCEDIVSLPLHPRITNEEIEYVCDAIREHYR